MVSNHEHPEDFVPDEPFLLIFVRRTVGDDMSVVFPADIYAAVQGWWQLNPEGLEPGLLVLARNSERVLGVFRTKSWRKDPNYDESRRWGFIGEPAEMSAQLRYMGKRVPQRYRAQNPIRYGPDPE